MELEVEWKVNITSGITFIDLIDLGVETKKEWNGLSKETQEERIHEYLMESDHPMIKFILINY